MNDPLPLYEGSVPCVSSGFCCRKAPCGFGEWDEEKQQCKYLEDQDDGTALCGRYEEILEMPVDQWYHSPAFGAGCCSPLFNEARQKILSERKEDHANGHE